MISFIWLGKAGRKSEEEVEDYLFLREYYLRMKLDDNWNALFLVTTCIIDIIMLELFFMAEDPRYCSGC